MPSGAGPEDTNSASEVEEDRNLHQDSEAELEEVTNIPKVPPIWDQNSLAEEAEVSASTDQNSTMWSPETTTQIITINYTSVYFLFTPIPSDLAIIIYFLR